MGVTKKAIYPKSASQICLPCRPQFDWADLGYIARRNVSFKMTDVIQLTHDAIAAVTEDDWASSCRNVEEEERKYWDADIAVEAEMEKMVIQVTSSDEYTDTATECSDYSDTESAEEECLCWPLLYCFALYCNDMNMWRMKKKTRKKLTKKHTKKNTQRIL